jgi:pimeloyl-ACP methyl ester carboxylesterase
MRTVIVFTILFLLIVGVPTALAQDDPSADDNPPSLVILDTQSIALTSVTNGRDYLLWVALPSSYSTSEQSYPVLYVLDPNISFLSVVEFVRWLGIVEQLPELIVVGIGYPTDDPIEITNSRNRDYNRAPDEFLEFISDDLLKLIDSTYRTDTTDRAIVGWSSGGGFVFHTLMNRPELFKRYIAIESLGNGIGELLKRDDDTFRESFAGLDVKLFNAIVGTEYLSAAIQSNAYDGVEATGLSLGDITHAAALHMSLPAGIMAVYAE